MQTNNLPQVRFQDRIGRTLAVGREGSLKLCLGIADLRYAFHLPQLLTEWMNRKAERGKFGEGERYALARNHVDSINIATVTGKEVFSALLKASSDCQVRSSNSSTLKVSICFRVCNDNTT